MKNFSLSRAKILTLVHKKERTIAELEKLTKLSRTNISHHLEYLQKRKLVILNKKEHKTGKPVFTSTNKANPLLLPTIEFMEKAIKLFKTQSKNQSDILG